MNHRTKTLATLTFAMSLLTSALVTSTPLVHGQRLDPSYLSQMPNPARVLTEIKGTNTENTIERQMGAFMMLNKIVEDMAYGLEHRPYTRLKPDEARIQQVYYDAFIKLVQVLKREDHTYDHDPNLFNEVLAKLFTPSFRDLYFDADAKAGARLRANFNKMYPNANVGSASSINNGPAPRTESTTTNNTRPSNAPSAAQPQPVAKGNGNSDLNSDSPATITHFENGRKLFDADEYEKAIPEFEQVIATGRSHARVLASYNYLCASYRYTRQYEKTIAAATKALTIEKEPVLYFNLGDAYERTLQFPKAMEAFKEGVRLNPKVTPYQLLTLGSDYVLNNRKAEAMQVYDTLVKIDKEQAEMLLSDINDKRGIFGVLLRRAELGVISHDDAEIVEWSHNALKLNPTNPDTLLEIGFFLQLAERYDEALTIYRGVIAKKPKLETLAEAHGDIGSTYLDMKQFARALPELLEANRLRPEEHNSDKIASAYKGLGQTDKAIAAFRDAIRINPQYEDAYEQLAETLNEAQRHDQALEVIREGLKIRKENFILINQLGITYYFLKQYPSAIGAFREAIRLYKDYRDAHFYLGRTFVAMGRKREAMQAYMALKPLDAKLAETLLNEINKP